MIMVVGVSGGVGLVGGWIAHTYYLRVLYSEQKRIRRAQHGGSSHKRRRR
jgi:hypothetical protein